MKRLGMAVLGFALCASVYAQTANELLNDGKNPDNITTQGMGYALHRYSALNQITKNWHWPSGLAEFDTVN